MKSFKKVLALVLSIAMVLSMFTGIFTVGAEETAPEATNVIYTYDFTDKSADDGSDNAANDKYDFLDIIHGDQELKPDLVPLKLNESGNGMSFTDAAGTECGFDTRFDKLGGFDKNTTGKAVTFKLTYIATAEQEVTLQAYASWDAPDEIFDIPAYKTVVVADYGTTKEYAAYFDIASDAKVKYNFGVINVTNITTDFVFVKAEYFGVPTTNNTPAAKLLGENVVSYDFATDDLTGTSAVKGVSKANMSQSHYLPTAVKAIRSSAADGYVEYFSENGFKDFAFTPMFVQSGKKDFYNYFRVEYSKDKTEWTEADLFLDYNYFNNHADVSAKDVWEYRLQTTEIPDGNFYVRLYFASAQNLFISVTSISYSYDDPYELTGDNAVVDDLNDTTKMYEKTSVKVRNYNWGPDWIGLTSDYSVFFSAENASFSYYSKQEITEVTFQPQYGDVGKRSTISDENYSVLVSPDNETWTEIDMVTYRWQKTGVGSGGQRLSLRSVSIPEGMYFVKIQINFIPTEPYYGITQVAYSYNAFEHKGTVVTDDIKTTGETIAFAKSDNFKIVTFASKSPADYSKWAGPEGEYMAYTNGNGSLTYFDENEIVDFRFVAHELYSYKDSTNAKANHFNLDSYVVSAFVGDGTWQTLTVEADDYNITAYGKEGRRRVFVVSDVPAGVHLIKLEIKNTTQPAIDFYKSVVEVSYSYQESDNAANDSQIQKDGVAPTLTAEAGGVAIVNNTATADEVKLFVDCNQYYELAVTKDGKAIATPANLEFAEEGVYVANASNFWGEATFSFTIAKDAISVDANLHTAETTPYQVQSASRHYYVDNDAVRIDYYLDMEASTNDWLNGDLAKVHLARPYNENTTSSYLDNYGGVASRVIYESKYGNFANFTMISAAYDKTLTNETLSENYLFWGSNDGTEYTALDATISSVVTRNGGSPYRFQDVTVDVSAGYKYVKITFPAAKDTMTHIQSLLGGASWSVVKGAPKMAVVCDGVEVANEATVDSAVTVSAQNGATLTATRNGAEYAIEDGKIDVNGTYVVTATNSAATEEITFTIDKGTHHLYDFSAINYFGEDRHYDDGENIWLNVSIANHSARTWVGANAIICRPEDSKADGSDGIVTSIIYRAAEGFKSFAFRTHTQLGSSALADYYAISYSNDGETYTAGTFAANDSKQINYGRLGSFKGYYLEAQDIPADATHIKVQILKGNWNAAIRAIEYYTNDVIKGDFDDDTTIDADELLDITDETLTRLFDTVADGFNAITYDINNDFEIDLRDIVRAKKISVGTEYEAAQDVEVKTIYVDSVNGGDHMGYGYEPVKPIKSLDFLSNLSFNPGDKILFKAGTTYTGTFYVNGSGTADAPIYIGTYGEGATPVITGAAPVYNDKGNQDNAAAAIAINGGSYIEIDGLELTNPEGQRGVYVQTLVAGATKGIKVTNCNIHDVDVNDADLKREHGGIIFETNTTNASWFEDIVIENNDITKTARGGIYFTSDWASRIENQGWSDSNDYIDDENGWYPAKNLIIRGNDLKNVGGDGILVIGAKDSVIEYNTIKDSEYLVGQIATAEELARNEDDDPFNNVPVTSDGYKKNPFIALWVHSCNDIVIQYNEVSGTSNAKGNTDSQAFDADISCKRIIFQNNYSHNNDSGAFVVIGEAGTGGSTDSTIIRNNLIVNEPVAFFFTGRSANTLVEGNTVYAMNATDRIFEIGENQFTENVTEGVTFKDNVFFAKTALNTIGANLSINEVNFTGNICYNVTLPENDVPVMHQKPDNNTTGKAPTFTPTAAGNTNVTFGADGVDDNDYTTVPTFASAGEEYSGLVIAANRYKLTNTTKGANIR